MARLTSHACRRFTALESNKCCPRLPLKQTHLALMPAAHHQHLELVTFLLPIPSMMEQELLTARIPPE